MMEEASGIRWGVYLSPRMQANVCHVASFCALAANRLMNGRCGREQNVVDKVASGKQAREAGDGKIGLEEFLRDAG